MTAKNVVLGISLHEIIFLYKNAGFRADFQKQQFFVVRNEKN